MTQQTAIERVRAELLAEAEKPFAELLGPLAQARSDLMRELDGLTDAEARVRPRGTRNGEDAWCIAEVLRHLVQAEEGLSERIDKLADGRPAEGSVPGRLGGHENTSLSGLVAAMAQAHERLFEVINRIAGHERLDTTAPHAFFGELNCRGWLAMYTVHLRSHARQVRETRAGL